MLGRPLPALPSGRRLLRPVAAVAALALLAGCQDPSFGLAETRMTTASQQIGALKLELQQRPSDATVLKRIGELQADEGFWIESMASYREALIVAPGDREALIGFGNAQLAVGSYAAALGTAAKAGGSDIDVLILRAGALAGLGRHAEARAILEQARQINPRDLDVRNNIALIAAMSGDPQAYGLARSVAFAPDAKPGHILNLLVVGGITGNDATARADAARLGVGEDEIAYLLDAGHRARRQGLSALAVLAAR